MSKRGVLYIAKFVMIMWAGVAGFAGVVTGIFYLCHKDITYTIIACQLVIGTSLFAAMGRLHYKSRGRRRNWDRGSQFWERWLEKSGDEPDEAAEIENGWSKRDS